MPPSPVVVDVPISVAARPSASFTLADSAPKLMPAMVIGMSSSIGFFAKRVPSTVLVAALLAVALERVARQRARRGTPGRRSAAAAAWRPGRGSRRGRAPRRAGCSRCVARSKPARSPRRDRRWIGMVGVHGVRSLSTPGRRRRSSGTALRAEATRLNVRGSCCDAGARRAVRRPRRGRRRSSAHRARRRRAT